MITLFRFLIFSSFLFWCGYVSAENGMVVEVYELRHANTESIFPVLKTLMDDGETAKSLGQRLIIKATPENHKKISRLLDKIDISKATLVVEVKQIRSGMSNAVRGGVSSGPSVRTSTYLGNSRSAVNQRIMVRDGEDAYIVQGEDIPYSSELAMVNGRHQGYHRQIDFKKTRTGFLVRPTLRGDTVDVVIVPFRENARKHPGGHGDNPPAIDYQEAATQVRIPLDSWFDVAGTASNREQDDLGTIRWSTGPNVQDRGILIRIRRSASPPATK